MVRTVARSLALGLVCGCLAAAAAMAAGGAVAPTPNAVRSPQEEAAEDYNRAVRYRDKAQELELKAAQASGAEQEKLLERARKQYQRAIADLESATEKNPRLHQAFSDLGYALRKTGDYERSLAAYEHALALSPAYSPAIEYRAEAFLGLERLDEAKQAYIDLFTADRERADQLLAAMRAWVEQRKGDPAGLAAEALGEFDSWVEEREQIAAQTAALYPRDERPAW